MFRIDARQRCGNLLFALLLFFFAIDPTNTIFHLKDAAFVLLMAYNLFFFQARWCKLFYFFIGVAAITIPLLLAMARGEVLDGEFVMGLYKALAPLCLLPWIHCYDVVRLARWPVFVTGLVVILLFWIIIIVPETETAIYMYMKTTNETIMMANRYFFGMKFFCMYHKSTACFLLVFAVAFYSCIRSGKRTLSSFLVFVVLMNTFLVSGTRMTVLFPFLVMGIILFHFYHDKRYFNYVLYPLLFMAAMIFVILIVKLMSDTSEPSNLVKYAHLVSYKNLFEEHPLYLLLGQGPGTRFFSAGFHRMCLQTEWTYVELIRYMGIFSALMLFVFLWPFYRLWKYRRQDELCYVLGAAYGVYLVIAGTNPLLLSSTGMFTLLVIYSFLERIDKRRA